MTEPEPDKTERPLVSICLPTYNSRQFLEERMHCILDQSYRNWELIVGDSFSDDGTWEYLTGFASDPRIRAYQIPRDGLFPGWNQCLAKVTGEYFYIATSDDTMDPGFLEKMVTLLDSQPDVDVATCNFNFINEQSEPIAPTQGIPGSFFKEWANACHRRAGCIDFLVHTLLGTSWTTITSALFRTRLLGKVGLFRTDGGHYADRFWAMTSALFSDTVHCPDYLATWRIHGKQSSKGEPAGWRKKNLDLTLTTLKNHQERIRELLPEIEGIESLLLEGAKRYYYEGFGLNRLHLRKNPARFTLALCRALIEEPRYVMRRLQESFAWEAESIEAYTARLIRELDLPWPPQALD